MKNFAKFASIWNLLELIVGIGLCLLNVSDLVKSIIAASSNFVFTWVILWLVVGILLITDSIRKVSKKAHSANSEAQSVAVSIQPKSITAKIYPVVAFLIVTVMQFLVMFHPNAKKLEILGLWLIINLGFTFSILLPLALISLLTHNRKLYRSINIILTVFSLPVLAITILLFVSIL